MRISTANHSNGKWQKRGSSLCSVCGCSNGNRAEKCKECQTVIAKKSKTILDVQCKKTSNSVSHLIPSSSVEVYSVKIRSQGPDYRYFHNLFDCKFKSSLYRCFVSRAPTGEWKCHNDSYVEVAQGRARSSSCNFTCTHIVAAMEESACSNQIYTSLSEQVLQSVPFPPSVTTNFEQHVSSGNLDKIIQRVSDHCFVVQTEPTSEAPLGLLHVRVDKKKQFHCSCSKFRRMTSFCEATTAPKLSKRCVHIYICLWAVFSCEKMKEEFSLCLFDETPSGITACTYNSMYSIHACVEIPLRLMHEQVQDVAYCFLCIIEES